MKFNFRKQIKIISPSAIRQKGRMDFKVLGFLRILFVKFLEIVNMKNKTMFTANFLFFLKIRFSFLNNLKFKEFRLYNMKQ